MNPPGTLKDSGRIGAFFFGPGQINRVLVLILEMKTTTYALKATNPKLHGIPMIVFGLDANTARGGILSVALVALVADNKDEFTSITGFYRTGYKSALRKGVYHGKGDMPDSTWCKEIRRLYHRIRAISAGLNATPVAGIFSGRSWSRCLA